VSASTSDALTVYQTERKPAADGRAYRDPVASLPLFKTIILYLGYMFDPGDPKGPRGYYHVIAGEVVGLIDSDIFLGELRCDQE
jgi:hypothetical protein